MWAAARAYQHGLGDRWREVALDLAANIEEHYGDPELGGYLDHFVEIRRLQTFINGRAEREGIPVIENVSAEQASADVIELVLSAAARVEVS